MSQTRTYAWPRNKTGRLERTTLQAKHDLYRARCAELEVENSALRAELKAELLENDYLKFALGMARDRTGEGE